VYRSAGRRADARRSLRRALEIEPENAELHYNLGNILRESGDSERAIAAYAEAIRRKPALSEAYINTAICLVEMEEYPRARDILSAFLNRYPASPRAGAVRQALEQVETLARTQRRTNPWRR
jgi:tetratricopeptide (TPR) repeat protein